MSGIHRLPALMFEEPDETLENLHLASYDILSCEPLHTIKGHITNLYEELPRHVPTEMKHEMTKIIKSSFNGKEAKRGSDYRRSLLDISIALQGKIPQMFLNLLRQLLEIQEILYADDNNRNSATIFRLLNLTFLHAITLKECIKSPKGITTRKLYGQYYHSLVNHAPEIYRITSMVSVNAEDEERAFCFLKQVASMASNHHPDNVIKNGFIRLQVHEEYSSATTYNNKISHVTRITKNKASLSECDKTVITFNYIEKNPFIYQLHLERIADFLSIEGAWKETEEGIEFNDQGDAMKIKCHHYFRKKKNP